MHAITINADNQTLKEGTQTVDLLFNYYHKNCQKSHVSILLRKPSIF